MATKTELAIAENRTIFSTKVISPGDYSGNLLKPISSNSKVGKGKQTIQKGAWKDFSMYSLTLEERATCPSTCHHWADCYGNNSFRAQRFQNDEFLIPRLEAELNVLAVKHPGGFVVRLHILGDFYSPQYVCFWEKALEKYPLYIYGYTARISGPIHDFLRAKLLYHEKVVLRFSVDRNVLSTLDRNLFPNDVLALDENVTDADFVVCPEQKGQTESCLTCGLCFNRNFTKAIKFLSH
jgi:hypothetical protein